MVGIPVSSCDGLLLGGMLVSGSATLLNPYAEIPQQVSKVYWLVGGNMMKMYPDGSFL